MIGTTAALILGGLTAGAKIAGSVISSKASTKASEQQQQSAQQAIAYAEPKYQQALQIAQQQAELGRAGLQPYNAAGTQGMTALTALLGLPGGGGGMDRAGAMPPAGRAPLSALAAGTAAPTAPTVMLRAPTGQVQAVPADHAEFFLARGAQRV